MSEDGNLRYRLVIPDRRTNAGRIKRTFDCFTESSLVDACLRSKLCWHPCTYCRSEMTQPLNLTTIRSPISCQLSQVFVLIVSLYDSVYQSEFFDEAAWCLSRRASAHFPGLLSTMLLQSMDEDCFCLLVIPGVSVYRGTSTRGKRLGTWLTFSDLPRLFKISV